MVLNSTGAVLWKIEMLRACKRAAACRWRRRIYATTTSTQPFSSSEKGEAEEGDWRDVGVFWDLENCTVPSSFDPFLVRPNIERALRTSGYLGPISISGFGDIHGYRIHTLEALSETGIDVRHVPNGSLSLTHMSAYAFAFVCACVHVAGGLAAFCIRRIQSAMHLLRYGVGYFRGIMVIAYANGHTADCVTCSSKVFAMSN